MGTTQSQVGAPFLAPARAPIFTQPLAPNFEGDFQLEEDLLLECGAVLRRPVLHYATYGQLNASGDNAVLVAHALSGSALVTSWWPQLFTSEGILDLDRDFVIGINFLGSCYGSTGPRSLDPATGQAYGVSFPLISIGDIVRSQALLIESLGIARLRLVIGASIGGMQALEWAISYPQQVATAVSIAAAPLGAMGLALNHLQRKMIELDPRWAGGAYAPELPPADGMALARSLAVCSYKSAELLTERFARKPDRSGEDPWNASSGRFDVAGFLDNHGEKFIARFDANSYIAITRTMDTFDPARGRASATAAYGRIKAHVILVGVSTDWLFPPGDVRSMAEAMQSAGVRCDYREMVSAHGHDAFLAEAEQLSRLLMPLLS